MQRSPHDVLARARILSLLSIVEDGLYLEMIPGLVDEFALDGVLTERDRAWLNGETELSVADGYQVEAMLVLAWSLGLTPEPGDRDPEAYGPVLNLLQGLDGTKPETRLAPRSDDDLRAMFARLEDVAARGEPPPSDERYGAECLLWRRAALRWLLDAGSEWPPA